MSMTTARDRLKVNDEVNDEGLWYRQDRFPHRSRACWVCCHTLEEYEV
jgi:hypothetical protein